MKNRKYKGVQVRGQRIRIYFTYAGERRYKSVDGAPTPETLAHYERVVETIEYEIKAGTFSYQKHFPDGLSERYFGKYVDAWLESKKLEVSVSSYRAYESRCDNWILPRWENIDAEQIGYRAIQNWTQKVLMRSLTNKTVRDIQSLMSQVFRFYRLSTGSLHNPTEGLSVRLADPAEPDPFTRAEIDKLLTVPADPQITNMIAFMVWSGVRISEALALAWEDIDFEEGAVTIARARVSSTYKVTKTRRSTRKVKLLRAAMAALSAQQRLTGSLSPVKVDVLQRDNRTVRAASLRFCFHNPNTGRAFSTADNFRTNFWNQHIEAAGVRHRGPGQCRHTFASQMLSSGIVTVDWVANQLGHTSSQMVWRHYGRWIPVDEVDTVGKLDRALRL